VKTYYDQRAPEYDEWYLGAGLFAHRDRPGWTEEIAILARGLAALDFARVLDVACGTGFLTRHLRGRVTALDHSASMLAIARRRLSAATLVRGEAGRLPFTDSVFDAVVTGNFYGHLFDAERRRFVAEARRVARTLVVVDAAVRADVRSEEIQERTLNDGTGWTVYKRFFTPAGLLVELGGGRILHSGHWFVAVAA
jgi:demethylmenaquinone methyltransferase/2-methoxy-6-polyprenyl-1,4-benzoquinol methylase